MEDLFDLKAFFLMNAEEKVIFLNEIIDDELSKSTEQIDCELIDECINFIGEITGDWIHMSEEEAKELFQILWKKAEHDINNNDKDGNTTFSGKPKKKIKIKKFFLIAAIVALSSALSLIIVGANQQNRFHNSNLFGISFRDLFKHKVYKDGNITYINQNDDEVNYYSSIEDFVNNENIHGLFLPEELEIKKINSSEYEGVRSIIFTPTDQDTYFCINAITKDEYGLEFDPPEYTKTKTKKDIDVWIFENDDPNHETGTTQVMFKINQWYYCIRTFSPESALELIDEFKEIKS